MNPILFLIPLLLVVSVPTAFAQIVETEGENYDLIENYFIGEATWQSHPDRIMNGQWENYVLTNNNDKVIFNSNAVGSLVFDKNSCSYSIYENGYNGANVIPSVSAMASFQSNGVWSNLPVNNEACIVTVEEYDEGVNLTSTKVITESITEDVFISYTGTDEVFYANATNSAFTLEQHTNGTNIGYYNGEVSIIDGAVIDRFTQELRLDIRSGFKETFKVWHTGDEPLGITQTIHTGESITIADQTINIAELNGQSFDRQYIVDNEAEILQLTDSINYDFDTGIDSLSNINIIFDGDYKVNMDYASGDFTNYLEIDPTFTTTATTQQRIITSTTGSSYDTNDCTMDGSEVPFYSSNVESKYNYMSHEGNGNGVCAMPMWEYDVSSIPSSNDIVDVKVVYDIVATSDISNLNGLDFITSDEQIGATSGTALKTQFEEMVANPTYLLETTLSTGTGLTAQLSTTANSDLKSSLSQGWFTIVTRMNPFDNHPNDSAMIQLNNVELQVTYGIFSAPNAPTGVSTTTGLPLGTSWTSPQVTTTITSNAWYFPNPSSGSGDGVTIGSASDWKFLSNDSNSWTISVWGLNADGWVMGNAFLGTHGGGYAGGSGSGGIVFEPRSSGSVRAFVNTAEVNMSFLTALSDTDWHHYVLTYDDSTSDMKLYLDNSLVGTNNGNISGSANPDFPLQLMATTFGEDLTGGLDDLAIWNVALDTSEVASLYAKADPNGIQTNDMKAFYNFEQTTGDLLDMSTGTSSLNLDGTASGNINKSYAGKTVTSDNGGNGGSAITGYNVLRSDYILAQAELPNNSVVEGVASIPYSGANDWYRVQATGTSTTSACSDSSTAKNQVSAKSYVDSAGNTCGVTVYDWDISSLPSGITVTDVKLRMDVISVGSPRNCSVVQITDNITSASASTLWTSATTGTEYVTNDSTCTTVGDDQVIDLGTTADSFLTSTTDSKFAVALRQTNMIPDSSEHNTMLTTYPVGTAPTTSVELEISYSEPNLTGEEIDFTDNEFLLHGLETIPATTSTFSTDFTSDAGWTSSSTSSLEVTNDELQYKNNYNGNYIYYDLGSVSDDKWLLQYKITFGGSPDGSDEPAFGFGLYDYIGDMNDSGDRLGMWGYFDRGNTWHRMYCTVADATTSVQGLGCVNDAGVRDGAGNGENYQTIAIGTDYWVSMTRDGSTFTSSIYTSADYTGTPLVTLDNPSVPSSLDNLQYLTASHYVQGGGITVVIDDVTFYNGVTSAVAETITLPDKSTNSVGITLPTEYVTTQTNTNLSWGGGSGFSYDSTANTLTNSCSNGWNCIIYSTSSFNSANDKYLEWIYDSTQSQIFGFKDTNTQAITDWDYMLYCGGTTCQHYYDAYNYGSTDENPQGYNYMTGMVTGDKVSLEMTGGEVISRLNGVVVGTFGGNNAPSSASGDWYVFHTQYASGTADSAYDAEFSTNLVDIAPTSITGSIGTAIQDPNLTYANSALPDNTDVLSVGGYVKLDASITNEGYSTSDDDSKFENGNSANAVVGQQITSGSSLIGKSISEISFYMYQNGASSSTDTVSFGVWDSSGNLKGSVFDTTVISTFNSGTSHTVKGKVTQTGTAVTIAQDDTIGARINSAPSGYTVYLATQNSDGYSDAQRSIFNQGSSPATYSRDVNFEVGYSSPPANTKLLGLNDVSFNVGTTTASITSGEGGGWSVSSDGTDAGSTRIEVAGATHSVTSSSAFTWSFWWNPSALDSSCNGSNSCFLLDKLQSQSGEYAPRTYQTSSGALKVSSVASGVGYGSAVTTSNTMTANAWNHIIIKQSGSTIHGILNDGTPVSVGTKSGSDSGENFRFFNPNLYMDGTLKNAIMYDTSLSASDITLLYNSGVPTTSSGAGVTSGVLIEHTFTDADPETNTGSLGGVATVVTGKGVSSVVPAPVMLTATGLTDNTSTAQHYAFTRDASNLWTIYQNGVSQATATDSTSLGTNVGTTDVSWGTGITMTDSGSGTATQTTQNSWTEFAPASNSISASGGFVQASSTSTHWTFGLNDVDNRHCFGCNVYYVHPTYSNTISINDFTSGTYAETVITGWSQSDVMKLEVNANGNIKFYQNGVLKDTSDSTISVTTYPSANMYKTGIVTMEVEGASPYTTNISGSLDEFFINSDTLTSTEIAGISKRGATLDTVGTTSASTTTFDDNTVTGGDTYYYAIQAVNSVGAGTISNFVSGLAGSPPDAPTGVQATVPSPNTTPLDVTVSWSAPTNVGTGTLSNFEIYRDGVLITTTGLVTSYADTVPSVGTYVYSAKAISDHGTSVLSSTTSFATATAPPAPNAPSMTITSPNTTPLDIDVSWTAQSNGGSSITSTEIFRSTTETGTYTSVGTVSGLIFTDVVPNAGTWYYKIASTNLLGSSSQGTSSSIATATVPPAPNAPTLAITSPNPSPLDIDISWTAQSNGGSSITSTEIFRTNSLSVAFVSVGTVTDSDFTDTVPNSGTWYYRTASTNLLGAGGQSPETSITTATVPTSDSSVTLTISDPNASPRGITVSLVAPSSDGGSAVTGYNIYSSDDNVTFNSVATGVTADTTVTVPTGGTWYFTSEPINNIGTATQGSSVSITTPSVPTASGVTLVIPSPDPSPLGVVATFTVPSSDGGSALTGYNLFSSSDDVTYDYVAQAVNGDQAITVANAGTWYFKSQAINNVGNGTLSTAVSITTASAPVNDSSVTLTITDPNPSPLDITISLVAPSGNGGSAITGYNIYSSPDDSVYTQVATGVTTDQTVTVANAGTWYFTSEAINNAGTSTQGSSVSIATPTVPTASSVSLTIDNPNPSPFTVTSSFISPSSDGGSIVTGFNLYSSPDDITYTPIAEAVNGNQTVTVANAGTWYFKSEAINNVGNGTLSNAVTIATPTVPVNDSSVTLVNTDPNPSPLDITISLVAPSSDGGSSITGYNVYSSDDNITFNPIASAVNGNQTVTVASAGTWYFTSEAINNVGTSTQGSSVSIATPSVPAPSTVSLTIDNPDPSPFTVTISLVPASDGGSSITGYNLFVSPDDSTYTQIGTNITADQTTTVANAGTWYFKSQAINNVGTGSIGTAVTIATPTVPPAPTSPTSVIPNIDTSPYITSVSWDLPATTGGSALTSYNVYRQTGSGAFTLIDNTTALTVNDTVPTGLDQSYTYKIHALNNVGESTAFASTTLTTGGVPSAPSISVTSGTTVLSWNTPSSDATVNSYKVYRNGGIVATVTTTGHGDFTPIVFGQSYTYTVVATSILGDSVSSNSVSTTPETEITGMIAQGVTGTGAVVDWDEPAYYQGQVTSYSVYYQTPSITSGTPSTSAGTTTNTYSNFAPQLEYNTSYTFAVSINSPLGNSGLSNLVTVTTLVDGSIVSADPTTGGMAWFDIDSVSEDSLNVIQFSRLTLPVTVNGTTTDTDTLRIAYPSWWDGMTCDVDYKFAQKTEQYVEGVDMTSVVNILNADQQIIGFEFQDINNEVIEVQCAPQASDEGDQGSGTFVMTQNDLTTGLPSIPIVAQVSNFSNGTYGTDGDFGALNIVGLFAILISMVGFNRISPIVGVILSASMIFALAWFGVITIPTVIIGTIALVIFLAWGANRQR